MATTIKDLARFKSEGTRFAMLTAYDFPTARILDQAGIPVVLVGDSLGQVVLGYDSTLPVTMDEMLHHTRAVVRGAGNALVVADMPFGSYQTSVQQGLKNAIRFLKDGGAHAVKFEGPQFELAETLTSTGIPVMGHLGLTPQSVHTMGGYRVQGQTDEGAQRLQQDALHLARAGVFAMVLEGIPAGLAGSITRSVAVPTIGIGAGLECDAQVLVLNDLLGLSEGPVPKFVKRYASLAPQIRKAVSEFKAEVESGSFPDAEHSYGGE